MSRRVLVPVLLAAVLAAVGAWRWRGSGGTTSFTGFVEGEERVIRSEVSGRVLAVAFAEGEAVPAGAVVARLDDADIQARLTAKRQELAVLDADTRTQEERVELVQGTWTRDLSARRSDMRQAETTAVVAERTLTREAELVKRGASTAQLLDDVRVRRDQATAALDRARSMLARTEAEERAIAVARSELASMRQKRELVLAQIAELEVTAAKYAIRAPAVATTVQTQFLWPGELAQPGTPVVAVLDPVDKYVQLYVPVADVARMRVGQRVEIELDSTPGRRVPGEVGFVADAASFTPEKIETRSDRMGQVYRVKVRILADVERFQPGTEGNVYLVAGEVGG